MATCARFLIIALASVATICATAARAEWPTRRINLIVPFAAGGGADPVARQIAEEISKRLGQPVTVDFRPGANGTIGATAAAKARPDGYTFLLTSPAPITNAKPLNRDLPYDPDRDFDPIIHIAEAPLALITNASIPAGTFGEFVEYAKLHPGDVTVAISGVGGLGHQAAVLMSYKAGIKVTYVPYNGAGSMMADMIGKHVNASAGFPAAFIEAVKDGTLRILTVFADHRVDEIPNVPSIVESGYPDAQINAWYILFAPKGTPEAITAKLGGVVKDYLATDAVKTRFKTLGYDVTGFDARKSTEIIAKDRASFVELLNLGLMNTP